MERGGKVIQASEEGRYGFGNEAVDNDVILLGGIVEFPMQFGNNNKGIWFRNGTISGPGGVLITIPSSGNVGFVRLIVSE